MELEGRGLRELSREESLISADIVTGFELTRVPLAPAPRPVG